MNARRLALRVATVGVIAIGGVGIASSPAMAERDDGCAYAASRSDMAAAIMDETLGTNFPLWNAAYTLWLAAENYLDQYC
jgi:hypothetical protein